MINIMDKKLLIDQIMDTVLDVFADRETIPEYCRNFTVYCNKEIRNKLGQEMFLKAKSISYIKNPTEQDYQNINSFTTVSGITLSFKVGKEYKILMLAFDSYPPLKD